MNYDKVILELLARIQVLEEQVKTLMSQNQNTNKPKNNVSTNDIRCYIEALKDKARTNGYHTLTIKSGDIHRKLELKNAMPKVCNAMRHCMDEEDIILFQTTSGYSSTLEIEYKL